jgi:hypothetical protein
MFSSQIASRGGWSLVRHGTGQRNPARCARAARHRAVAAARKRTGRPQAPWPRFIISPPSMTKVCPVT